MFLRQMKESPRKCVFDPPTCFFKLPYALLKDTSKERLYECKMKSVPASARRKASKAFIYNVSFMAHADPLAPCCRTTSEVFLTFSRSLHSAGPLCLSQGPAAKLKRTRFCFLFLLSHSGVLAQGQKHLKFPAG